MRAMSRGGHPAHRIAVTVTACFVAVGLVWVLFSDVILYGLTRDRVLVARLETAKGWIFVALSGVLLYAVAYRTTFRLSRVWRLTAAIVESIGDGVLLLAEDRTIAYANSAAQRILRCSGEELVGMDASEFSRRFRVSYPNGALIAPEDYISQRVFQEGGPRRYKAILHPPGGAEVIFVATATPVRFELDEPAHWVVSVLHDLTEIEHLHDLRDRFFAAAAHSLKTPVAIIKANAQALMPVVDPAHRGIAASLERQSERIDRLIHNLLILARARSRTLELHPVEIDLAPLVEHIAREETWSHRHEVQTRVTGKLRAQVDEERLALVIRNFMHEASRLSPAHSPLTVQAGSDGEELTVGIGYRPLPWREYASDVYDEYDDIGIGRSVARTIVEAHGGSLSEDISDSEVTIWIHLPASIGVTP